MSGVRIELRGCGRTFVDGTRALAPIDLAIEAGETLVLLGPSGCGKTTTLRLIAGLDFPDAGGSVRFDGTEVTRLPIERRQVGMVFQGHALFPHLDVHGNVGYGLKVRGVPRPLRERRVGELLEMMQIAPLASRRVDQLSGGQRQRVALARALAPAPRVLLLDEPLSALDARLRESLRFETDRLLRQLGITAVYVTHDQAEAMALAGRIAVMDHGRILQVGTPREIYFAPAGDFVAGFVGTTNRVRGEVRDGHFHAPGLRLPLDAPPGAAALAFRPEQLRLAAGEGEAHLHGTVASASFLGDHVRLQVALADGQTVLARVDGRREFATGEPVHLAIEGAWRMDER